MEPAAPVTQVRPVLSQPAANASPLRREQQQLVANPPKAPPAWPIMAPRRTTTGSMLPARCEGSGPPLMAASVSASSSSKLKCIPEQRLAISKTEPAPLQEWVTQQGGGIQQGEQLRGRATAVALVTRALHAPIASSKHFPGVQAAQTLINNHSPLKTHHPALSLPPPPAPSSPAPAPALQPANGSQIQHGSQRSPPPTGLAGPMLNLWKAREAAQAPGGAKTKLAWPKVRLTVRLRSWGQACRRASFFLRGQEQCWREASISAEQSFPCACKGAGGFCKGLVCGQDRSGRASCGPCTLLCEVFRLIVLVAAKVLYPRVKLIMVCHPMLLAASIYRYKHQWGSPLGSRQVSPNYIV